MRNEPHLPLVVVERHWSNWLCRDNRLINLCYVWGLWMWMSFEVFQTMPDLKWLAKLIWVKKMINSLSPAFFFFFANQYNTSVAKSSTSNRLQPWFWQELQLLHNFQNVTRTANDMHLWIVDFCHSSLKTVLLVPKFTKVLSTEINTIF